MTTPYEEGDPGSKILFLAEAPSYMEIRMGRPLCGPSGDVFNRCLHEAGLIRRASYILNVWPFQVQKDKQKNIWYGPDKLWDAKKGLTDAGYREAQGTIERINKSSANVVVSMGNQATELMIGRKIPITKWRGSPLMADKEYFAPREVIPTIHPAATLHGTALWQHLIQADMEKADRHKQSPALILPRRDIMIYPSFEDIMGWFRLCREKKKFATDLEVINHQVHCLSLCVNPHEGVSIPFVDERGRDYWREEQEIAIWMAYAALMEDPDIIKINQNIVGFDAPFLFNINNINTQGFLGDTMIAQHIMYPDFPKGLDFITSIHTDEPYYKDEGKMWRGYGGDIEEFWRYNGKDAMVAFEAWDVLVQEMDETGYWETYNMTARLHGPLTYMGTRGVRIDYASLEEVKARVGAELADAEAKLEEVAEYPFNPGSPKQCQKYFYGTKGLKPYLNSQGGITTDDKAMSRIVRKTNLPEARLVQKIRGLRKLKGTYLEFNADKDGRLRCSWNPRGTWTGRLSSSKTVFDTGMNMQNLDPRFKAFLVTDDEPI